MDGHPPLSELLERHRGALVRFLEREARGLFRWESAEDLAQGVHLHALGVEEHFTYQGDEAFLGWLFKVARQHISRRNAHWRAMKRDAGTMLRVSTSDPSSASDSGVNPGDPVTGPATFAERRDRLRVAVQAVSVLTDRDRQIVQWMAEDLDIQQIADRLEISYDAAQRARHRAIGRFRQAYVVLARKNEDEGEA